VEGGPRRSRGRLTGGGFFIAPVFARLTLRRKLPCNPGMLLSERHEIGKIRVDREAGIIHGAKIIGHVSKNGRTYPPSVLAKAAPMYEGAEINIDHSDAKSRSVIETFGVIKGVTVVPGGDSPGLYGDVHFNKKHQYAEQIAEAAERFPHTLGLSHNADGTGRRTDSGFIVEEITKVISVDLVKHPATTSTLFEGLDQMKLRTFKLSELVGTLPATSNERKHLARLMEEGAMSGDATVTAPENASPEQAIKAAFRAEVMKAVDDESLDFKATLARVKDVLKAQDKVLQALAGTSEAGDQKQGGESGGAPSGDNAQDQEPTTEGQKAMFGKLVEKIEALEKKLGDRDTHAELKEQLAGREVDADTFKALLAIPKEQRAKLIEQFGKKPQGAKPRTTGTSAATGGKLNEAEDNGVPKGKNFREHLERAPVDLPARFANRN
jgi:hypothetical protein